MGVLITGSNVKKERKKDVCLSFFGSSYQIRLVFSLCYDFLLDNQFFSEDNQYHEDNGNDDTCDEGNHPP